MKNLNYEQIRMIYTDMGKMRVENPKANIVYNVEQDCIQILYPLPKDFYKFDKNNNKL